MKDELNDILVNLVDYVVNEMTAHMKEKDGAELVFNHIRNGGLPITSAQILKLIESRIDKLIDDTSQHPDNVFVPDYLPVSDVRKALK